MYVVSVADTKELTTPHGKRLKWLLTKEIGAPNFEMRYFEIPESAEYSEGAHPWEHEIFVVKGEGILRSGGEERVIKPGDAVFIPSDETHGFQNPWEEALGLICVIPAGCEDHVKST